MYCEIFPEKSCGNKANNLAKCINLRHWNVIPGISIKHTAFLKYLRQNHTWIYNQIAHCDFDNLQEVREVSANILKRLKSDCIVPETVMKELTANRNLFDDEKRYIIRSSAKEEDTIHYSYAGCYETVLNVRNLSDLIDAIKDCYESVFDVRSLMYLNHVKKIPTIPLMSLLIQEQIKTMYSGTLLTSHPDFKNTAHVVISENSSDAIGQGSENCAEYFFNKQLQAVNYEGPCSLDQKTIFMEKLFKVYMYEICNHLNEENLEIEFGYDGEKLYLFQVRPVSLNETQVGAQVVFEQENALLRGIAIPKKIPHTVFGRICITDNPEDPEFNDGDILVVKETSPKWQSLMFKAGGLITDHGVRSSHAAIVSKEIGLPAIVGTLNATKVLKDHAQIMMHFTNFKTATVHRSL